MAGGGARRRRDAERRGDGCDQVGREYLGRKSLRHLSVSVMATGRSDYPNQVNNSLGFPGLFRGIFDVRASEINDEMKLAAARALASVIPEDSLGPDFVIPSVFDANVVARVAAATAQAAIESGVARRASRSSEDEAASYTSFRLR